MIEQVNVGSLVDVSAEIKHMSFF